MQSRTEPTAGSPRDPSGARGTRRVDPATAIKAIRFAAMAVSKSQAPAMAANLAFRTLFGLLPVLVVATIVTRAILGDGFDELVSTAVHALGLHTVTVASPDGGAAGVPLGQWIETLARDAANVDLKAIGIVGGLTVLFSAIWTMVAIESSFNAIYRAPSGRPFVRRVLIYWFVITAGPVLFAAIPLAFRAAGEFMGADSLVSSVFARAFSLVGGFVSLWILIAAAYATVPNAKVDLRAAIVGAFVATLLIEIGKRFLGASLAGSFSASRLYGSLGLVPLFMLWVYLMWLVILYGLQVAAILQGFARNGRSLAAAADGDCFEPAQAIDCFHAICGRFRDGKGASADTIVRACGIAPPMARALLVQFERSGLVHRIDGDERRFAPSRPPEQVHKREVLRAAFALADGGAESHLADEVGGLREAQVRLVGDETFAPAGRSAG